MRTRQLSLRLLSALVVLWSMQCNERLATATPADDASQKEAARTLGNRAADAIARGEFAVAEDLLRQAYEQYPAPTIALLHARTLVHLQRLAAAASVYQRAILTSVAPDAPQAFQRAVEQARSEEAQLLPIVPRLQVVVRGGIARESGMRLQLDGRALPEAQHGRWMLVDPGRRVVGAELNGETSEQVVRIEQKQSVVVEVSAPPGASASYRAATWSALGVGIVGVGTGIVTGIIATSAHSEAERACEGGCVEGSDGARHLERFRTQRVVSTLGYALGAAGLGVGSFLLIRGARSGPSLRMELDQHAAFLRWGGTL